jgi:hypothetical protein
MMVDLGQYGKQEIDFNSLVRVSTDLNKELYEGAAAYAYVDFVTQELRRQYDAKKLALEEVTATRREILGKEIADVKGKAPTVADMDAAVAKDATCVNMKEEMLDLAYQIDRVRGFGTALSQKHSNVKMLAQREISGLLMQDTTVTQETKEPMKFERKPKVRGERKSHE